MVADAVAPPLPSSESSNPIAVDSQNHQQTGTFAFSKHTPDILNRLMTEITGAQFVGKVSKGRGPASKGKESAGDDNSNKTVDVDELLKPQPKKRKTAPKRKAAAKSSAAVNTETAADLQEEVTIGDKDGVVSRPRCWVDDLLCCLAHAAGGVRILVYA